MIKKLIIDNFRSIDHLEFEPKRINIIIGEEGTGMSTLLEALGLVGFSGVDQLLTGNDGMMLTRGYEKQPDFSLQNFAKYGYLHAGDLLHRFDETDEKNNYAEVRVHSGGLHILIRLDNHLNGYNVESVFENYEEQRRVRYYSFNIIPLVPCYFIEYLLPGMGVNFWKLAENDADIIKKINDALGAYGMKFGFDASKGNIPSIKPVGIDRYLPISNLSDAIQLELMYRLTQWKDAEFATLIYPYFGQGMFANQTKSLCWNMSMGMENTQFFISTYDENVVIWLLEKTPKDEIGLYATYMDHGDTKLYEFSENEISDLMSYNVMFSFPRYLPNYEY